MTYKGYAAPIEYDDDDLIFTGRIAGIRDGAGFHADSVDGLIQAFHEAVEEYLETCAKMTAGTYRAGQRQSAGEYAKHCEGALALVTHGQPVHGQPPPVLRRADHAASAGVTRRSQVAVWSLSPRRKNRKSPEYKSV